MIYVKGFLGAVIIWIILAISKSKNYFIAGLVPLFPTFGLLAHFIVYFERNTFALKETIMFGMLSLLSYIIYLFLMFIFIEKVSFFKSIFISLVGWIVVSLFIILIW